MHLALIGPGRIGQQLAPILTAYGYEVTILTRHDYGDFASRTFHPEEAIAQLKTCDGVLLLAGLFMLDADVEQISAINAGAPIWLAECVHERFPQAAVVTFLDSRIHRLPEALPENVRAYVESKRRLYAWTLRAAKAWGRETGARVNGIALGPVLPPPDPKHSEKGGETLTPRPTIDEIARGVDFLMRSPSVTGQILYLTAGQHLL